MVFIIITLLVVAFWTTYYFSTDRLTQFGGNPEGTRLERLKQSPQYNGEKFVNEQETGLSWGISGYMKMLSKWFFGKEIREPEGVIPIIQLTSASFKKESREDLRVTWLGHSTALIEINGYRILTDPVWSKRCSPSTLTGPARFYPVPISLDDVPHLDAIIISHDHYDHLDKDAVRILAATGVPFYVPLGVGAHLEKWGIVQSQIFEMDWWDSVSVTSELDLIATPARHFSGRGISMGSNLTLWTSWVIIGPSYRMFFSGDTGEFPGLADIGQRYGPFDLTMIESGAYDKLWPDLHLNPRQAVAAHLALRGGVLMPIHWGTFNLAYHDWFEPPEWLVKEALPKNTRLAIPRPGQTFTVSDPPEIDYWWRYVK
ncbi:Zn-dependent hydrolase [candidate division LCP-89 bacterium B3_LCP]|uniref:Zn-dependent hydrolase n=1 Tax=candidate division LCP-89 bacterium B3_LCP TaxID=2012998 RepID=A0A532V3V5_UNCL8|nr:MAG: Zn-dependent hydrolase [candidate division LCP-89 bacterium B3_LCP]